MAQHDFFHSKLDKQSNDEKHNKNVILSPNVSRNYPFITNLNLHIIVLILNSLFLVGGY